MNKNISLIVFVIVSVLFAGLIFYGIKSNIDIKKSEIVILKMQTCGQLYRYTETLISGAINSYPMEKEYKECLNSN